VGGVKTDDRPESDGTAAGKRKAALLSIWLSPLGSVRFAVTVIILIATACVVGTVMPQNADAAGYVQAHPDAASRFAFFGRLGLTHIFSARWFIALLCVLAASVMVCSTRRLTTIKRVSGSAQRRALGSMLTHLSILLILAGAVVRGIWGEKGYIELREGESVVGFEGDRGARPLPFELQLTKFEIETDPASAAPAETAPKNSPTLIVQWTGRDSQAVIPATEGTVRKLAPDNAASAQDTFRIEVLKYVPDFSVDTATHEVTSRSSEPNNPAVLVAVNGSTYKNHRWVFAKFPDFTMHEDGSPVQSSPLNFIYRHEGTATRPPARGAVKNFKSTFILRDAGGPLGERTAAVNHPLKLKGYTFYQTGYNPNDPSWTSLEVVHDPGVPLVYAGFILLIGGLFTVFYLNPWLTAREAKA
jgi:hypothetical protein